jgi:ABC-type iron transport system FetAB permease component
MARTTLLTVIQKIALGYLLTACFGLVATVYALSSLGSQTIKSNELINGDYDY